jgi:branched-chain amino acid aminotransferase
MARGRSLTFFQGEWREGNVPIMGSMTHAAWQGSSVFDGGRVFEGVMPDIQKHAARLNASARTMGLNPTMSVEAIVGLAADGAKKMGDSVPLYVKPMYWGEGDGPSVIMPDPDDIGFALVLFEAPMPEPTGISITLSPFRRPTVECALTDAKAGCLYPNNARALREARARGFDNALVRDMLGNVAETTTSNIFMAKDGVVRTPASNGTFLNGITRQRVIGLMRGAGLEVIETALSYADFETADEIFISGNYSKVMPVTRIDGRNLQPGPAYRRARELYWDFSRTGSA